MNYELTMNELWVDFKSELVENQKIKNEMKTNYKLFMSEYQINYEWTTS